MSEKSRTMQNHIIIYADDSSVCRQSRIDNFEHRLLCTAYGSRGRYVSHRACTRVRHSALSAALCVASAHDFHPTASCSFSIIRRHVSFGVPIDLFPTCVQFITIRQSFVFSNRRIWPIKLHRLALMMSVILLFSTSS